MPVSMHMCVCCACHGGIVHLCACAIMHDHNYLYFQNKSQYFYNLPTEDMSLLTILLVGSKRIQTASSTA